jgi:hypothetical protein
VGGHRYPPGSSTEKCISLKREHHLCLIVLLWGNQAKQEVLVNIILGVMEVVIGCDGRDRMNGRTKKKSTQLIWSWGGSGSNGGKEGVGRFFGKVHVRIPKEMKHGLEADIEGCRIKWGVCERKRIIVQKERVCKYEIGKDRGWVKKSNIYKERGSGGKRILWGFSIELMIKIDEESAKEHHERIDGEDQ